MFALMRTRAARYVAAVAVVLVAAGASWWVFRGIGAKQVTAYFDDAVGLYSGSEVRVLGVSVGAVDTVRPGPEHVTVTITIDRGVAVPAGANAVVVEPSVVAGRYIQLTPAYTTGPELADGAVIPRERTATPVEIDRLYDSLHDLATALGPNGANADGALSDLLDTGSANLEGNGQELGRMLEELGKATRTLSNSQDDLFATIDNLQSFTTMLANNDSQVRQAERQLADVSDFLAEDRHDLAAALDQLATALDQVEEFIESNRGQIETNVDKLADLTQLLVNQRRSLAEALDVAPLAATNLVNTYDPVNQTLDGRTNLNELSLPLPAVGPTVGTSGAAPGGDR